MRDLVSSVLLARAQEQSDAALTERVPCGHRLSDETDVPNAPKPERWRRERCLECGAKTVRGSYCAKHDSRVRKTGVSEDPVRPSQLVKQLRHLPWLTRAA